MQGKGGALLLFRLHFKCTAFLTAFSYSLKATVSGVWKPLGNSMSPDRLLCMIDIGRSTGPSQVPSKGKVPTQLHVGQVVEGKVAF